MDPEWVLTKIKSLCAISGFTSLFARADKNKKKKHPFKKNTKKN